METKVEALEDSKVKVTVTVDAAQVDAEIAKTYKDFARKYNFPGFRKGKAPRPVIDNALGKEAVLATVTEDVINAVYPLTIEAEKLFPTGRPEFDAGMVEAGKPFVFTYTTGVKPTYELTSYEPLEIELPVSGVTEADIEEQIDALREHYTVREDASAATKLKPENYADLAIKATDEEGQAIVALESESLLYNPGSEMFPEVFDAEVLGMKKGQAKEFTLEVPADDASLLLGAYAGKKVNFEVTCLVVKKVVVPEFNDEWAKETMGFESAEDMRQRVSDTIEAQKNELMPRVKQNAVYAELVKRFEGEVPAAMVEDSEATLLQEFFTQLQRQGLTFDNYLMSAGLTADQFKADVKHQAEDEVKQDLALDAWARNKGIEANDEDVSAEFIRAGLEDPAKTEQEWRESGRLYLIREGVIRAKALQDLIDNAKVTEVDFAAQAREEKKEAKKPAKKKTAKKDEAPAEGEAE